MFLKLRFDLYLTGYGRRLELSRGSFLSELMGDCYIPVELAMLLRYTFFIYKKFKKFKLGMGDVLMKHRVKHFLYKIFYRHHYLKMKQEAFNWRWSTVRQIKCPMGLPYIRNVFLSDLFSNNIV